MTELLLIRHGETDWNRRQCFQGQIDIPLNARGHAQAQRLAERLRQDVGAQPGTSLHAAHSSDLSRAVQTAAPSLAALQLQAQRHPALREQAFGILEGLSFDEIRVKHPQEFARWASHDPDYALPGGAESRRQFHARVISALSRLAAEHFGQRLLIVTHGGVLDMVWRQAKGLSLQGARECAIPNAGINRLRVKAEHFEILSWAEDQHLQDLPG